MGVDLGSTNKAVQALLAFALARNDGGSEDRGEGGGGGKGGIRNTPSVLQDLKDILASYIQDLRVCGLSVWT